MLSEQDYSIIGFTESMTELDKCIDEFRMSQSKMTASAINSWSGTQMKAAEKKLHDASVELTIILDHSYQELHTARRAYGLKNSEPFIS